MIELYSGTPGSGKSLHCAKDIILHIKLKRPIICNFDVDLSNYPKLNKDKYFTYVTNENITPQFLYDFSKAYFKNKKVIEERIFLVIDEAQLIFNAREWQKQGRNEWLSFFTQHRKLGYHIILITQFDRMLDRQIRCLIEYEWIHRKVGNIGVGGLIFSFLALGNLFICVKKFYPLNEKVGQDFFKAKKKLYQIYDTYNTF